MNCTRGVHQHHCWTQNSPGTAANPTLEQELLHTLQPTSLSLPHTAVSTASCIQLLHCLHSSPAYLSQFPVDLWQERWEFSLLPVDLWQESWECSPGGACVGVQPCTQLIAPWPVCASLDDRQCSSRALSSGKIIEGDFSGGFLSCKHCLISM